MLDYGDELDRFYGQKEWYLKHPELSPLIEDWGPPGRVEIEGNNLIYDITKYGPKVEPDQATMRKEILGVFLELADADDQGILEYARKWGVLGLCKHGLPAAHRRSPDRKSRLFIPEKPGCTIKRKGDWLYESLDRWRYYARLMRSIVSLAVESSKARVRNEDEFRADVIAQFYAAKAAAEGKPYNEKLLTEHFTFIHPREFGKKFPPAFPKVEISAEVPGKVEDWQIVLQDSWDGSVLGTYSVDPVRTARINLSSAINRFLELSGVEPRVFWSAEARFVLRGRAARGFLFPALAVQLMLLINGSPDYALCSS